MDGTSHTANRVSSSTAPTTSFVFAPTRSSLARRTAVLSKDTLERHAQGAARYRPSFASGNVFDNELFTKGFVPLGSGASSWSHEAGPSTESPSAPLVQSATPEQAPTRTRRALSESNSPPTPPPTPYGPPVPPAAGPEDHRTYNKLSLSELTDMVVQASLTPAPNLEIDVARAYPFPSHHRHRSNSQREQRTLPEGSDRGSRKAAPLVVKAVPRGEEAVVVLFDSSG